MEPKRLNLDISSGISELEELARRFKLKNVLYKILFRGRGLEFDGYRDFSPDEDSSNIDWKASLRANKLLAKQYIEERDIEIMIVLDVGEQMVTGSQAKLKCEYSAEVAAALSYLIIDSGDKLGFALCNDQIKKMALPKKGSNQFNMFVDEISNASNYFGKSDLNEVLKELNDSLGKNISAVIIISDFFRLDKSFARTLNLFSNRFETIAILIRDNLDKTLPELNGRVTIEDPATGRQMIISPAIAKKIYEKNAQEYDKFIKNILEDSNVDFVELNTAENFAFPIAQFLEQRVEKKNSALR